MIYPDDLPEKDVANLEHKWVKEQLIWCDMQIKLHQSSDKRAVKTIEDIYRYSRELRDYTTIVDGQVLINTNRPNFDD